MQYGTPEKGNFCVDYSEMYDMIKMSPGVGEHLGDIIKMEDQK